MKPTEGTILTVAREMGECASKYSKDFEDFESFFALVTDAGNKALAKTPEMLPKLKQAGVVDSGGQGLMYIIEGMYFYLSKNTINGYLSNSFIKGIGLLELYILSLYEYPYVLYQLL